MSNETPEEELRRNREAENLVLGARRIIKAMQSGKVEKIYVASNCKPEIRDDISHFASISGTTVVDLSIPNDEVGTLVKRPFAVAVCGFVSS